MPPAKNQKYHVFPNPCLPYDSYGNPTNEEPSFVAGSNLLLSAKNQVERRPGFATALESGAVTQFVGTVKRIFGWRRWDSSDSGITRGSFFVMICETTATTSKVYKQELGVDTVFQLIYTATAVDGVPFDFIEANNNCFMGNGNASDMRKYDGRRSTYSDGNYTSKWGIAAPSSALTIDTSAAGTLNASAGYNYVSTYGNSSTGHQSNASDISACTTTFSAKTASFTVTASTDPQVDEIHVFRTTDNGGTALTEFRELSTSPFPNTTATVTDQDADEDLQDEFAPGDTINDPPPGLRGFVHRAGRIWGFRNNEAWYSAFEEAPSGTPEECWPGALAHNPDGNFYPYGSEVTGLASIPDGVGIWSPLEINAVMGDSLDTFFRVNMSKGQGARQNQAIKEFGGIDFWLDTMNTVWMQGGQEIGFNIRTDLTGIVHSTAQMTTYLQGENRWLVLLDGAGSKLYVFDFDLQRWMPPWIIGGSQTCTAIWSGETSVGNVDLVAAIGNKIYKLNTSAFNDAGQNYAPTATLGLTPLSRDASPDWLGIFDSFNIERNDAGDLDSVEVLLDDDPLTGTFSDMTVNLQASPLRSKTGTGIVAQQYTISPGISSSDIIGTCRRVAVKMTWPAEDRHDVLYSFHIGYHET